jgi:hypothetical protein
MKFSNLINETVFNKTVEYEKDSEVYKIIKNIHRDPESLKVLAGNKRPIEDYTIMVLYTHIDKIKEGNIIVVNGKIKEVDDKDIKKDSNGATTIFGDNFNSGKEPVKRLTIYVDQKKLDSELDDYVKDNFKDSLPYKSELFNIWNASKSMFSSEKDRREYTIKHFMKKYPKQIEKYVDAYLYQSTKK